MSGYARTEVSPPKVGSLAALAGRMGDASVRCALASVLSAALTRERLRVLDEHALALRVAHFPKFADEHRRLASRSFWERFSSFGRRTRAVMDSTQRHNCGHACGVCAEDKRVAIIFESRLSWRPSTHRSDRPSLAIRVVMTWVLNV